MNEFINFAKLHPDNLTTEQRQQMRADSLNSEQGSLTDVDCSKCKNRGYIAIVRDYAVVCVECECVKQRKAIREIKRSGLANVLGRHTLDSYTAEEEWQQQAKETAEKFLRQGRGKWLLAVGVPGAGKTHLCTAVCGELLNKGYGVRYMLWRDEVTKLKQASTDGEFYKKMIDRWKQAQVLYIDDFFKVGKNEEPSTADVGMAFEILNFRYADINKTTIISTERTIGQILDIDEAVGSRIFERAKDFTIRFDIKGKNYRLREL